MTIFYGGTEKQVRQQLSCSHDWHGPCIDKISRYFKCTLCFCLDRDCTKDEYYEAIHTDNADNAQQGNQMVFTLDDIDRLITQYVLTKSDDDMDEWYASPRIIAGREVGDFMEWLKAYIKAEGTEIELPEW